MTYLLIGWVYVGLASAPVVASFQTLPQCQSAMAVLKDKLKGYGYECLPVRTVVQ